MTDKEAMDDAYEKMISTTKDYINDKAVKTDINESVNPLDQLNNMSHMLNMIMMAGNISKHQYYKVPVEIEGQYVDMNVMIKSGKNVPEDCVVVGLQNTKYAILSRPTKAPPRTKRIFVVSIWSIS